EIDDPPCQRLVVPGEVMSTGQEDPGQPPEILVGAAERRMIGWLEAEERQALEAGEGFRNRMLGLRLARAQPIEGADLERRLRTGRDQDKARDARQGRGETPDLHDRGGDGLRPQRAAAAEHPAL